MIESIHDRLVPLGWNVDYFTSDDCPKNANARTRRYAFGLYVRRVAREAYLRGNPYNIINIHEPHGVPLVIAKERFGSPHIVATSHGVEQRYWELRLKSTAGPDFPDMKTRLVYPLTSLWQSNLTLKRADSVLCLNREDRTFISQRFGVSQSRVWQVCPGFGQEFVAASSRRDYERPIQRILFSGTWIHRKGIQQLVGSFVKLASRNPSLQLGVLGAGVDAQTVLDCFPEQVRSQVCVYGPLSHSESADLLVNHDIFLLPSMFEGTPLALIEAMSTGMPIVTTRTCGMKDVVLHEENGILVEPGDSDGIVEAIDMLIRNPQLRKQIGQRALSDSTSNYTWEAAVHLVNRLYTQLVAAAPISPQSRVHLHQA